MRQWRCLLLCSLSPPMVWQSPSHAGLGGSGLWREERWGSRLLLLNESGDGNRDNRQQNKVYSALNPELQGEASNVYACECLWSCVHAKAWDNINPSWVRSSIHEFCTEAARHKWRPVTFSFSSPWSPSCHDLQTWASPGKSALGFSKTPITLTEPCLKPKGDF